jgi:hypothetical protein
MTIEEIRNELQIQLEECESQLIGELNAKSISTSYSHFIDNQNIIQMCGLKEMIRACEKIIRIRLGQEATLPVRNQGDGGPSIELY